MSKQIQLLAKNGTSLVTENIYDFFYTQASQIAFNSCKSFQIERKFLITRL